jgi:FlaA1/EpsC-like NDP-sugar epimerase
VAIEFTGPRPGEQLHERLLATGERSEATASPRIVRAVRDEPLDPEAVEVALSRLRELVDLGDETDLASTVVEVIGGAVSTEGAEGIAERR